jgi:hypothetical protein
VIGTERMRVGIRVGIGSGLSAGDPRSGVTQDATSLIYTPNTAAEWTTFLAAISSSLAAPDHLWRLQEASGHPADSIGSKTLTATTAGNAPGYQRAITGWTRKAIGGPGSVAANLSNTAMVNTATTSFIVFLLARSATATVALRSVCSYGSPAIQQPMSAKTRFRLGASITDSTLDHAGATVHPYLFAHNVTGSTCKLYSDLEKITATFGASVGSTMTLTGSTAAEPSAADFLYACAWDAATITDAEAKGLIRGLGYAPTWT